MRSDTERAPAGELFLVTSVFVGPASLGRVFFLGRSGFALLSPAAVIGAVGLLITGLLLVGKSHV